MEVNPNLSEKAQQDYILVKKAVEGNEKAFADLMERYREAIYFMLLKMVNNPVDAEDLTIEAFGKAFKSIEQYTPTFAFSTWLFKIATNNCIDFIRKKRGTTISLDQNEDESEGANYTVPESSPDPEENMIKQQKNILMRDIVTRLKPRYRHLVELRYFKEYSYDEIAEEMDLPLGTVKAQLFRARELLFNILKHSGHHY